MIARSNISRANLVERIVVLVAFLFTIAPTAGAEIEYDLIIVDAFDGSIPECYLYDVNDIGHACGTSTHESFYNGFVWDVDTDKTLIPITWVEGINNLDQMVGDGQLYDLTSGNSTFIPPFNQSFVTIYLHGLNDEGIVVGHAKGSGSDSDGVNRTPIVWDAVNGSRGINVLAARELLRINNNGWAVGNIRWSAGDSEGFLHNVTTGETINLHDLLSPDGLGTSSAADINDNGVATGEGWNGTAHQGFVYSESNGFTFLPGLNGGETLRVHPKGINEAERVVGSARDGINGSWNAFIWDVENGMRNMNDLIGPAGGFILDQANAISDTGWIVGYGHYGPGWGVPRGFVLRPVIPASAEGHDFGTGQNRLRLALGSANPSTGSFDFEFSVESAGRVRLDIHDVSGRWIANLMDSVQAEGSHRAVWDGRRADGAMSPAGVYYVRLHHPAGESRLKVMRLH